MLEHDIPIPKGWQSAWLHRTLPALQWYTTIASYMLSLAILALGLSGFIIVRRSTKRLAADSASYGEILRTLYRKTRRIAKGHFFIANIYILHALVIAVVDAVLCAGALSNNVSAEPELWTRDAILEVALYSGVLVRNPSISRFARTSLILPPCSLLSSSQRSSWSHCSRCSPSPLSWLA